LDDPAPANLTFKPTAHVRWTSDDGRVAVAAWQDEDRLGIGKRWIERPSGFTAFSGMTWHRATAWNQQDSWASQMAELFERKPLDQIAPEMDGLFTAV